MIVDLIAYTQRVVPTSDKNPLDIVEEAASICYDSSMTDDYKIAKGCKASGHYSVLEHINFTFYVKDVSRALLAQISRHRHISMSVMSQRYVPYGNTVIPDLKIDALNTKSYNDLSEYQKNNIIKLYDDGYSTADIGDFYGIAKRVVQGCIKQQQKLRTLSESKQIHKDYFKNIDTPIKAYILGLIATDGNIATHKDGRHNLNITQHVEQRYLLQNIISQIKDNGKLNKDGHGNKGIKIQVQDETICNDLINMGITPRKTCKLNIDKIVEMLSSDENLLRNFIRGIVDGDGHISYRPNDKCGKYYTFDVSGSEDVVRAVRDVFSKYCKTPYDKKVLNNCDNGHRVTYSAERDVKSICEWLYSNIDYRFVHLRKLCAVVSLDENLKNEFNKKFKDFIEKEFKMVIPDSFLKNPYTAVEFLRAAFDVRQSYNRFVYSQAKQGKTGEKAYEDARAVLPNACCTEFYITMNARALIEMSHLRLCSRAQKEIREMFTEMKKEVTQVCPEVANWMVPSCEANPKYPFCPEGRGCCGRHPRLADVYKPIEKNKEVIDANT